MADHVDLIAEISHVEKMSTQERLKHAKKRRSQQLKRWQQYERHLEKESVKKRKSQVSQHESLTPKNSKNVSVSFINSVMLLEGAARNDLEEVRQLLELGVSPDVSNEDGLTALHQCCIDDNENMLTLLIEYNANVNARDSEAWTPLHAAATCGHVHLCKILIDSGAELLSVNADGNMPYDICEDDTTLDFVESEMAKRGVTQEEIDSTRDETEKQFLSDLKELASRKGNLEYKDLINGATPLHIAAANGYMEVGEFLLEKHVAVDAIDADSWQPIHAAACWCQPEMLELLVKYGANIDAKTRNGETPFDICEDPDLKQKILDLKDALETKEATRRKEIENLRRKSHSRRSSLYSSNTSLSDMNLISASIRRSSMREKNLLSLKDAKDEAARLSVGIRYEDDESVSEGRVPATNIDDISVSTDINQNNQNHHMHVASSHKTERKHLPKDGPIKRTGTRHAIIEQMEQDEKSAAKVYHNDLTEAIEFVDSESIVDAGQGHDDDARLSGESRDRDFGDPMASVNVQRERGAVKGYSTDVLPQTEVKRDDSFSDNRHRASEYSEDKASLAFPHVPTSSVGEKTLDGLNKRERKSTNDATSHERVVADDEATPAASTNEQNAVCKPIPLPRVPPAPLDSKQGTLAELKKQRSEKYNSLRLKDDVQEQLEEMYRNHNTNDEVIPPKSTTTHKVLAPAAPHKQTPSKNGHGNRTGSSPMAKFSAPVSSPVVGSPRKNKCCVIL